MKQLVEGGRVLCERRVCEGGSGWIEGLVVVGGWAGLLKLGNSTFMPSGWNLSRQIDIITALPRFDLCVV